MGTLTCLKCAQTVKADTHYEAHTLIDHAATSKKCSGNMDYMRWNGEKFSVRPTLVPAAPKAKTVLSSTTKATKKK